MKPEKLGGRCTTVRSAAVLSDRSHCRTPIEQYSEYKRQWDGSEGMHASLLYRTEQRYYSWDGRLINESADGPVMPSRPLTVSQRWQIRDIASCCFCHLVHLMTSNT